MRMNRIQFQPGLSMPEFFERHGTERSARRRCRRHAGRLGFVCPKCGGAARSRFVRGGLPYWQCGACPHQTSLISRTVFEASKLPLCRWFVAMNLLTQSKNNVSALELKRQLGVSYRSAWLLKHKIMQAMRPGRGLARTRWPYRDRRCRPRRPVLRQGRSGFREQGSVRRGGADHRRLPPAVRLPEPTAADPAGDGGVCRQPHRPDGHRRH